MRRIGDTHVVRTESTLIVYCNQATAFGILIMGSGLVVAGAASDGSRSSEAMDVLMVVTGGFALLASLHVGTSSKALLIVNPHGISSPLQRQVDPIEWDHITGVEKGSMGQANTICIRILHVPGKPKWGTTDGLQVPCMGLPVRSKKLIPEILDHRPTD